MATMQQTRFDRNYTACVRKLINGFNTLEQAAVVAIAAANNEEVYAFPMWGSLFQPTDSVDTRKIREMLVSFEASDLETARELRDDYGLEVDEEDFTDDDGDLDEDDFVEAVNEAWRECDSEEEQLASSGWQRVGETGILALDLGGDDLFLGINGAGYSFYGNAEYGDRSGHWPRLYDALGYGWHVSAFRADVVGVVTRLLCKSEPGSDEEREMLSLLREVQSAADHGGDLAEGERERGDSLSLY